MSLFISFVDDSDMTVINQMSSIWSTIYPVSSIYVSYLQSSELNSDWTSTSTASISKILET